MLIFVFETNKLQHKGCFRQNNESAVSHKKRTRQQRTSTGDYKIGKLLFIALPLKTSRTHNQKLPTVGLQNKEETFLRIFHQVNNLGNLNFYSDSNWRRIM